MASNRAPATKVFPDRCVCNVFGLVEMMTANAPNSGGLDNTTSLYHVKADAPDRRCNQTQKQKAALFEQPFYFLSEELKANG
jgi:hypothetical protein